MVDPSQEADPHDADGESAGTGHDLFEALPYPATLIDARGIITGINGAFIEMGRALGREVRREERIGYPVERFTPDETTRQTMVEIVCGVLEAGTVQEHLWEFSSTGGTPGRVRLTASPLRGADGEVTGGLLLWQDRTGEAWQEEQRARRERLRDALWQMRRRPDVPQVLRALHLELRAQFPQVGNCSVQVYQAETGTWATHGVSTEQYREVETREAPGGAVELCWREQRPVYRADLGEEDPFNEAAELWERVPGLRSVLDVPFFLGTLAVNSTQPHAFDERDIEALSELARVLSEGLAQLVELKSQARYRALVETPSNLVVMYLSLDGRYLYVSPQVEAATGYGPHDYYADPDLGQALTHPEDFEAASQAFRRVAAGGGQERLELRWRHRGGGYRAGLETISPILQSGGTIEAVQVVFQDITERTLAEQELRTSLSLLHASLESTEDGILIVDRDGRMAQWNQGFLQMWGIPDEVAASRDDDAAIAHVLAQLKDSEQFVAKVRHLYAHPAEASFDRLEFRDGRTFERYSQPQRLGDEVVGRVWSFRDITERLRAEQERERLELQIQQTQRLESLGVLAGGIAHDFNNILTPVLGHAQLALTDMPPDSPARSSIEEIEKAARHASQLCRQMLAYSGSTSFALEPVDLGALLREMVHLLKASIAKKVVLNLEVAPRLPPVAADPSQIRQIVMNLVINASESMEDRGGTIAVRLSVARCDAARLRGSATADDLEPGEYVWLEVVDTGTGMEGATLARIFDPFYTTKFTGRGLGLAAVLGIVRSHRGAIDVDSKPGRGTTFRIMLPVQDAEIAKGPGGDARVSATWSGKGTVLLVDDEAPVRLVVRRMLEHLGFDVVTAADGGQAVEEYREHREVIDLVLLDLTMPNMDGAEAYEALRALDPEVRVALASGYSEEEVAARFAGKRLAGVIQKPYNLDALRSFLAGLSPRPEA